MIDYETGIVALQYGAWLYVGPRGSNLGPCACVAKALPTEPAPSPTVFLFGFHSGVSGRRGRALDSVVLGTPRVALKVNQLSFWEPIL